MSGACSRDGRKPSQPLTFREWAVGHPDLTGLSLPQGPGSQQGAGVSGLQVTFPKGPPPTPRLNSRSQPWFPLEAALHTAGLSSASCQTDVGSGRTSSGVTVSRRTAWVRKAALGCEESRLST